MTQPNTPDGVITRAAQRITATREATRALAEEVRAKRDAQAAGQEQPPPIAGQ